MYASDTRRTSLLLMLACMMAACSTTQPPAFRETDPVSPSFYAPVLRDTCGHISAANATSDAIRKITIYKSTFREKLVETGSIINYASINDGSSREVVDYRPPRSGYRQDMYLVRTEARCHPDAWFYYSVWYRFDRDSMKMRPYGFGKAYAGTGHSAAGTIYFHTALSVKESAGGYSLRPEGKAQFYFVLDRLPADTLRVNRIVMEEKNKFGGPRSYVFKVAEHFPDDLHSLSFGKAGSQFFNQTNTPR